MIILHAVSRMCLYIVAKKQHKAIICVVLHKLYFVDSYCSDEM